MPDSLSWYRLSEGLREARRIIRDTAGYHFAGSIVPVAPEFKQQALDALDAIEHEANLFRCSREFAKWRERRKAEIHDVEVAIGDGRG